MSAYWIAHVTIFDEQQYQEYLKLAPAAFQKYKAKFIARGEEATTLEGPCYKKHVVIEFDSMATALACYHSPEYSRAKEKRLLAAEAMITLVDGLNSISVN